MGIIDDKDARKKYQERYGYTPEEMLFHLDAVIPSKEYAAAGEMFELLKLEDINRTTEDFKNKLSTIVSTLYKSYEEGSVGSIDNLPQPKEVMDMNPIQIDNLITFLQETYFC